MDSYYLSIVYSIRKKYYPCYTQAKPSPNVRPRHSTSCSEDSTSLPKCLSCGFWTPWGCQMGLVQQQSRLQFLEILEIENWLPYVTIL